MMNQKYSFNECLGGLEEVGIKLIWQTFGIEVQMHGNGGQMHEFEVQMPENGGQMHEIGGPMHGFGGQMHGIEEQMHGIGESTGFTSYSWN
ncbi:MAG: hypothetical protein WCL14_03120 [Bacteroidota bacterium]